MHRIGIICVLLLVANILGQNNLGSHAGRAWLPAERRSSLAPGPNPPSAGMPVTQTDYAASVSALQDQAKVKAANDYLDKHHEAILREWSVITEINAPSGQEHQRAAYLERLLRSYRLQNIHYDAARNLIAVRKGSGGGRTVVFDAHLDTVFQPGLKIKTEIRDGRIYAPGIGDDTRNIEALLATIRALDAAQIKTKGDLVFVFTTEEETALVGAKHFVKENKGKVDYYVRSMAAMRDLLMRASASTGIAITSSDPGAIHVRARRHTRPPCRWRARLNASIN